MKMREIIIFLFLILFPYSLCAEEYIINSVPFFSSKDFQCGPASMAMVFNFLGVKINPDEISEYIYSKGARGTAEFDMILFAKRNGFKTLQYRGSIEDIKDKIKAGRPLIVMVDEGLWFYKKYHYMVVVGFDDSNVIVNSGQEEHKKINISHFYKKWSKTDFWTLLIER
uniref:Peptidase C39 domain-containing protein n=1 Tax=Thermodesulfovibrio aggregans TaxID=86166 RepID=A0A7C4AJ81_9BACT